MRDARSKAAHPHGRSSARPPRGGSRWCKLVPAIACLAVTGPALAVDKLRVTGVECEAFWLWKHTPIVHYDIVDERRQDYETGPAVGYWSEPAARIAEYCDRTSRRDQQPLGPPRKITGVWFQSNDGQFKALYDLEHGAVDFSAGVVNQINDRHAADQRAAAQHAAQLEEVRTREARAQELKAAELKAQQDKAAADAARQQQFFDSKDLQLARLGTEATLANFAFVQDVRTNPFHYKKLGLAVVRTQFTRMLSDKVALFGGDLAPVILHIGDVDRFTRSGETVMLALRVIERGDVERSYGSLPEIILSALKAEPIYGDYVGAYTCPNNDCEHIFDAPPPS